MEGCDFNLQLMIVYRACEPMERRRDDNWIYFPHFDDFEWTSIIHIALTTSFNEPLFSQVMSVRIYRRGIDNALDCVTLHFDHILVIHLTWKSKDWREWNIMPVQRFIRRTRQLACVFQERGRNLNCCFERKWRYFQSLTTFLYFGIIYLFQLQHQLDAWKWNGIKVKNFTLLWTSLKKVKYWRINRSERWSKYYGKRRESGNSVCCRDFWTSFNWKVSLFLLSFNHLHILWS